MKTKVGFEISVVFNGKQVFRWPNFFVEDSGNEENVKRAIALLRSECERRGYENLRILTITSNNKRKFLSHEI